MRTVVAFFALLLTLNNAVAQDRCVNKYFNIKLKDVPSVIPEIQEYDVALKRRIIHPVENRALFAEAIKATFRVLDSDSAEWHNVGWAKIDDIRQEPAQYTEWPEFNNLKYKTRTTGFLKEDYYKNIPPEKKERARELMADIVTMQEIGWYMLDSLEFNKEFLPEIMENYDIAFEGSYSFSSKYLKYIWSGITLHNNKLCAVVKFESLFNPFHIDNSDITIVQGRSMYYGEMWVSLTDKQIEYSEMVEDVIFNEFQPDVRLFDLQRSVIINKIK